MWRSRDGAGGGAWGREATALVAQPGGAAAHPDPPRTETGEQRCQQEDGGRWEERGLPADETRELAEARPGPAYPRRPRVTVECCVARRGTDPPAQEVGVAARRPDEDLRLGQDAQLGGCEAHGRGEVVGHRFSPVGEAPVAGLVDGDDTPSVELGAHTGQP